MAVLKAVPTVDLKADPWEQSMAGYSVEMTAAMTADLRAVQSADLKADPRAAC